MDDGVRRVVDRLRAQGERVQGPGPVTVRHVDPASLRPAAAPVTAVAAKGHQARTERLARGRRSVPERKCENERCDVIFKPTSPNQRFHSVECREARDRQRKEPGVPEETTPLDDELRQRYIGLLFRLLEQGHEEVRPRVDRQLAPLSVEQLLALAEDEPWPALLDHIEVALNGERPSG